jgi:hypothetical protein
VILQHSVTPPTSTSRRPRSRRAPALLVAIAALALVAGACSGERGVSRNDPNRGGNIAGSDLQAAPKGTGAVSYGTDLKDDLTIGLVISSAGPGKDFQQLAAGTQVVPVLAKAEEEEKKPAPTTTQPPVSDDADEESTDATSGDDAQSGAPEGASSEDDSTSGTPAGPVVEVVTADDLGTPEGAVAAVAELADQGADVIVYGSVGSQLVAGAQEADRRGLAVITPYDASTTLMNTAQNVYTIALPDKLVADKLVDYLTSDRSYERFGIAWDKADPTAVAQSSAAEAAIVADGDPSPARYGLGSDEQPIQIRKGLKALGETDPQALFVFGDAGQVFKILTEWRVAGLEAQVAISPRAAVPTLSSNDINAIAPPVRNGTVSVGLAGGPWLETDEILNYYDKRKDASKTTSVDLTLADVASADAGLIAVRAAEEGGSTPAGIRSALDGLKFKGIGADYDFQTRIGVTPGDYAIVAYNREPSSANTFVGQQFPDPKTAGGFWVALPGTAPSLGDLDRFER